jgi:hypothetical protein
MPQLTQHKQLSLMYRARRLLVHQLLMQLRPSLTQLAQRTWDRLRVLQPRMLQVPDKTQPTCRTCLEMELGRVHKPGLDSC